MKLVLAILALACTAFGSPHERFERDTGLQSAPVVQIHQSCPDRCITQQKYRDWFTQMLPKLREVGKQLAEGGAQPVVPTLQVEKWDQICTEVGNLRTCVGNCNDPSDAEQKTKGQAILNAAHDVVCDAEIKAKAPCLVEVAKVPSPTCNTQCAQYKQPIIDAYNQYKQTGHRDWERVKTAGKNVCLLINCRLKCRKNDIEQKCQAAGYTAAKKLVKELAILGQTTHAQFRPAQNYPDECKPDKVIQGA